jgi:hypothetical protein
VRTALVFMIGMIAFSLAAQDKPRVFVAPNTTRRTEEYKNRYYDKRVTTVEDRTVEIARDLSQSCKEVTVSTERRNADYVLRLSRLTSRPQIAVSRRNGDLVGTAAKPTVGGAVKAACEIITKDQTSPTAVQ